MDTTLIIPMISGAAFVGAIAVMVYLLWCSVTMRDSWLYQHFHPQAEASMGVRAIAIVATASHSEASSPPSNALDGDPKTRWSSGVYMQPNMGFQLDLGSVNVTEGVLLNHMPSRDDHPETWSVVISTDAQDWQVMGTGHGLIDASWPPSEARYIRAILDKPNNGWWWSIHQAIATYHAKPVVPPVVGPPPIVIPPVVPPPVVPPPVIPPIVPPTGSVTEAEAIAYVDAWGEAFGWLAQYYNVIDMGKSTVTDWRGWLWKRESPVESLWSKSSD